MDKVVYETIVRARKKHEDDLRHNLCQIMNIWVEITENINVNALHKKSIDLGIIDQGCSHHIYVGEHDIKRINGYNGIVFWFAFDHYDRFPNELIKRFIDVIPRMIHWFFKNYQAEIDDIMKTNDYAKSIIEKFK